MATTRAEAAVMEQAAARFEQGNQQLQTMLKQLLARLEALQGAWQGAAAKSFTQVKQQWTADQQAMQQALLETANAIRTAGRQYTTSDTEAATRVAQTNRGVQLPL